MLDPIVAFFDKLVTEFSWRRLVFVVVLFAIAGISLWTYESYTRTLQLGRLERTTRLLKELSELSRSDQANAELSDAYKALSRDVRDLAQQQSAQGQSAWDSLSFWKGAAAALPWIMLFVCFIPRMVKGETEFGSLLLGMLVFAIPSVAIGIYLPAYSRGWINYFIYPWGSMAAVLALVLIGQKANRYRSRASRTARKRSGTAFD